MKIRADQEGNLVLEEVYNGVLLRTDEGDSIGVCMRDGTFEITLCPVGKDAGTWRVNMAERKIEPMKTETLDSRIKRTIASYLYLWDKYGHHPTSQDIESADEVANAETEAIERCGRDPEFYRRVCLLASGIEMELKDSNAEGAVSSGVS